MTIKELITLAENRLVYYRNARAIAFQAGDVAALTEAERSIAETEVTLEKLRSLEA
jgi:hypothetical protein